MDKLM